MSKTMSKPGSGEGFLANGFKLLLAAAIGGGVVGAVVEHKISSDDHRATVVRELSQPFATVQEEVKDGQISRNDVTEVVAPVAGYVYNVAPAFARSADTRPEVREIMSNQTNHENQVFKNEQFYLPTGDVGPQAATNSNSVNK